MRTISRIINAVLRLLLILTSRESQAITALISEVQSLEKENDVLREKPTRDVETGLFNYLGFVGMIQIEIERTHSLVTGYLKEPLPPFLFLSVRIQGLNHVAHHHGEAVAHEKLISVVSVLQKVLDHTRALTTVCHKGRGLLYVFVSNYCDQAVATRLFDLEELLNQDICSGATPDVYCRVAWSEVDIPEPKKVVWAIRRAQFQRKKKTGNRVGTKEHLTPVH